VGAVRCGLQQHGASRGQTAEEEVRDASRRFRTAFASYARPKGTYAWERGVLQRTAP
jgi:hypothetical protein